MKRSKKWTSKAELYKKDVLQFHYLELKQLYYELVDSLDYRVVRKEHHSGMQCQLPLCKWIWSIMRQAYRLSGKELDMLVLNVLGDFRKLSLNPTGRHRRS